MSVAIDQALLAAAAGAVPAPAGSEYGSGRLQVVRWDDGQYGILHPALASLREADAYTGLNARDRARWEAFDVAEAWPTTTAGLPPRLVDVGDILQVERGPRSHTTDLRQVQSIQPGSGAYTGGLEFKVTGVRSPLFYPERSTVPVFIPKEHPSLPAALQAATITGARHQETAAPTPDAVPAVRPAVGDRATPPLQEKVAAPAAPTRQPQPVPATRTTATAGQPAPGEVNEAPGHRLQAAARRSQASARQTPRRPRTTRRQARSSPLLAAAPKRGTRRTCPSTMHGRTP